MRENILEYIRCPICQSDTLKVSELEKDQREIREGQLICSQCNQHFDIHNGIVNLLPNPSEEIMNEQQGWRELLGETTDELTKTMLQLPYLDDNIWTTTRENFDQVMSNLNLSDKRVLDIGAGRCWSTRWMIKKGASYAIAVDILQKKFIGLETADIYFEHDACYFERILGNMNDLPVQMGSFDVVFMTATLHHSSDIKLAMQQVSRALAPDGIAVLINEPVRSLFRSKELKGNIEIEHGINENTYTINEYLNAIHHAGLKPKLLFPRSISQGLEQKQLKTIQEMGTIGHKIATLLWRLEIGRKVMQSPLLRVLYLVASMPLVAIAKKGE